VKRLFVAASLVAVGLGAWIGSSGTGTTQPRMATVSAKSLASRGIALVLPQGAARISRARADAAALRQFEGTVRETVLATVVSPNGPVLDGCLCWVVSIRPANPKSFIGHGESQKPIVEYLLVFVDARTGRFVYGAEANSVAAPG